MLPWYTTASSMCTSVLQVRELSLTWTLPCSCCLLGRTNLLPLQGKQRHNWLGPHLISGSFLPWPCCWHCLSWSEWEESWAWLITHHACSKHPSACGVPCRWSTKITAPTLCLCSVEELGPGRLCCPEFWAGLNEDRLCGSAWQGPWLLGGGHLMWVKTMRLLRHSPHLPEFQAREGGQGLG